MIPAKKFYMVRHGESVGNRDGYFTGSMDVVLSDEGIKQAQHAHNALKTSNHTPNIIIHSALGRARHTAEIINQSLQLEMVEDAQLNEQNFGNWEGESVEHFREFYLSGKNPDGGESFAEFYYRGQTAITDAVNKYESPLIVCHGGIFRAFSDFYNQKQTSIPNAVIHHFSPNDDKNFPWEITVID